MIRLVKECEIKVITCILCTCYKQVNFFIFSVDCYNCIEHHLNWPLFLWIPFWLAQEKYRGDTNTVQLGGIHLTQLQILQMCMFTSQLLTEDSISNQQRKKRALKVLFFMLPVFVLQSYCTSRQLSKFRGQATMQKTPSKVVRVE